MGSSQEDPHGWAHLPNGQSFQAHKTICTLKPALSLLGAQQSVNTTAHATLCTCHSDPLLLMTLLLALDITGNTEVWRRSKQPGMGGSMDWEISPERITFYTLPGQQTLHRLGYGSYGQVRPSSCGILCCHPACWLHISSSTPSREAGCRPPRSLSNASLAPAPCQPALAAMCSAAL